MRRTTAKHMIEKSGRDIDRQRTVCATARSSDEVLSSEQESVRSTPLHPLVTHVQVPAGGHGAMRIGPTFQDGGAALPWQLLALAGGADSLQMTWTHWDIPGRRFGGVVVNEGVVPDPDPWTPVQPRGLGGGLAAHCHSPSSPNPTHPS